MRRWPSPRRDRGSRAITRRGNGLPPACPGRDEIVVPTLFAIEVGSVLVRNGAPIPAVRAYVDRLLAGATVVPLGPRAARQARDTAMRWALRAADAVYVWIAARDGAPLCTLDRKLDQRAGGACEIIGP